MTGGQLFMQRANAVAVSRPRPIENRSLMTPARRAGLEALEREFSELLAAYQSQAETPSAAA